MTHARRDGIPVVRDGQKVTVASRSDPTGAAAPWTTARSRVMASEPTARRERALLVRPVGVLAVLVLAVTGCAVGAADGEVVDGAAVQAAAHRVLADWAASHPVTRGAGPAFLPTGDLLVQRGDWTAGRDPDGYKLAFVSGRFDLPPEPPPPPAVTVITWPDGASTRATSLPPVKAIGQAVGPGADRSLPAIPVTSIAASTLVIPTTRGPATVPAWDLALGGTPVHVFVVSARAAARPITSAAEPGSSLTGIVRIDRITASEDGRTLTASFVGAPEPASQACGEDYTADTIADHAAVVMIVYRHPSTESANVACTAVGGTRTAIAQLSEPLDGRPVLDLYTGQPVALTVG